MDSETSLSRRRLLATAGSSAAALTVGSGVVAAQDNGSGGSEKISVAAIMPETGMVSADENYTGFLLKLTERLETDVGDIGDCTVGEWSPSEPIVYDAQVVDTVSAGESDSYEVIPTSTYLPSDTTFEPGNLFVINSQSQCSDGFLGITLENIRDRQEGATYSFDRSADESGGDDSGAIGPGFGPLAAAGGVLGGAYALARRGRDGD